MHQFHHPNELIQAVREGELVILMDDEHRENEGDFVLSAQSATPEKVNFMLKHGRGLLCVALSGGFCERLELPLSPKRHQDRHDTAFTLSVDAREGITTGISAFDRAKTIRLLSDPKTTPDALTLPGHLFPLREAEGGLSRRHGHTEAAVALARLAGHTEAAAIIEILNEEGLAASKSELFALATQHNLKIGTVNDLVSFVNQS